MLNAFRGRAVLAARSVRAALFHYGELCQLAHHVPWYERLALRCEQKTDACTSKGVHSFLPLIAIEWYAL